MGNPFDESLIAIVSPGLHVLAADSQNTIDPYELLISAQHGVTDR